MNEKATIHALEQVIEAKDLQIKMRDEMIAELRLQLEFITTKGHDALFATRPELGGDATRQVEQPMQEVRL